MTEAMVEVRNITHDIDGCVDVVTVVGGCVGISEAPFEDGADFQARIKPSLVLGAYQESEVIGGLIAIDFGKRLLSMMSDMKYVYSQSKMLSLGYDVDQWLLPRHQDAYQVVRPPARHGLEVKYVGVRHDRRGNGVGRLLMESAIEFATNRGSEEVNLLQLPQAGGFYDRLGFEPTALHGFLRRLSLQ